MHRHCRVSVLIQTSPPPQSPIHPTTALQTIHHKNNENSPASHNRQPSRTCFFWDSSSVGYHFWALCAGWTTSRVDEPNVFDAVLAADIVKKLTCRDGRKKKKRRVRLGEERSKFPVAGRGWGSFGWLVCGRAPGGISFALAKEEFFLVEVKDRVDLCEARVAKTLWC